MCGRFFLDSDIGEIAGHYDAALPQQYAPRYNIAPTTPVLARTDKGLTLFRWGLVPSWSKDLAIGNRMFNARGETVAEKPSFRHAYRRRRCLVAANGFYEWRRENGVKQPYCCHLDRSLFSLAGIWEQWQDAEGNHLQTCAIITTGAKGEMSKIHERMPVYISPQNYQSWLDCRSEKTDEADEIVRQSNPQYQFYAVSTAVNNARHEGKDLVRPLQH